MVSAAIILLCLTLLIGTTYALFTDTQSVKNHLSAGDLEITLLRTELVKKTLDETGYLVEQAPDKTVVDFTGPNKLNVFDIQKDEKIVPGSRFVATMQVENHSDVAFGYWVEVVCTDKEYGENLAKQLKVTVNTGTEAAALVADGLVVKGPNGTYIDELAIGETGSFVVTVEFLDSFITENNIDSNDLAQGEKLTFDLVVHAVQATK
jgi:predicted ribosomally synthesized peptide with SipW-like signal peptide